LILVFDSGVGGLSVLDAIRSALPGIQTVYAADNVGFPYGTKSEAEIAARVPVLLGRLTERYRPRLVVVACNTASTIALGPTRAALGVPVVGTVPAIKPATAQTRTGVIGLLGTQATVRQPYVDELVAKFAGSMTVLRHGAPALVEAAEAKLRGMIIDRETIAAAFDGLMAQPGGAQMDTVVLACTHFPLLAAELSASAPGIALVESGAGIARRVATLLGTEVQRGPSRAVFTAASPDIEALRPALAKRGLDKIETL
jgi:glutamate racemase